MGGLDSYPESFPHSIGRNAYESEREPVGTWPSKVVTAKPEAQPLGDYTTQPKIVYKQRHLVVRVIACVSE